MEEDYNKLTETLKQGKNQFLRYSLIHDFFGKVMDGNEPIFIDKDKVKDIFSEEDIKFFNEYMPAVFKFKENYTNINDSQRKELSDMFGDIERVYRQISCK